MRASPKPNVDKTCEICGKVFAISFSHAARGEGRFCSKVCHGKHKYQDERQSLSRFMLGELNGNFKHGNPRLYGPTAKGKFPEKHRARKTLARAVAKGLIVRPERCQQCKAVGRIDGHHSDYAKPLEVEWLCMHCHKSLHVSLRPSE